MEKKFLCDWCCNTGMIDEANGPDDAVRNYCFCRFGALKMVSDEMPEQIGFGTFKK